jgi:hypothetical protein
LGKAEIPRIFEVINEKTEGGKKLMRIIELNEITFTELVLSIDVSSSNGSLFAILYW